ncbi:MAG: acyl carrier protein [Lachnospiraceae bacterium]|jgi:acyl carrier protein|nr:acyl carrier protein [Lachnospiraceae bacterium]
MEFDTLKQIIADVLGVDPEEITEDTTFTDDLGADSLDLYQILLEVQDRLGIEIDENKVQDITTVGQALEMIEDAKN